MAIFGPSFKRKCRKLHSKHLYKLLIQFQRITISLKIYWEDRLVNEQTTVFRHYDTVSVYRQLAAKKMLQ